MGPRQALRTLLGAAFQPNELRTLLSTDLYLGDLSADLPPPGAGDDALPAQAVEGLMARRMAGRSFFRSLQSLRPKRLAEVRQVERICSGRRVLLMHGAGEAALREAGGLVLRLESVLAAHGQRVMRVPPLAADQPWPLASAQALDSCELLVALHSPAAAPCPRLRQALERCAQRADPESGAPLCILVRLGSAPLAAELEALLDPERILPCNDEAQYTQLQTAVLKELLRLNPLALQRPDSPQDAMWPSPRANKAAPLVPDLDRPGPIPRERAFSSVPLPQHPFCQELLLKAPQVRLHQGRVLVSIDRRGVTQAIRSAADRNDLWLRQLGSRRGQAQARAWDKWLAAALRGAMPPEPAPETGSLQLRWGGAGMLSLVRFRDRDWIPFLFRDIPPVGWNLALGASNADDDLDDPLAWGLREFQEELLVLSGKPRRGEPLILRPILAHDGGAPRQALDQARRNALPSLALRERDDGLAIVAGGEQALPGLSWQGDAIWADPQLTRTDLLLRSAAGTFLQRNLLVAINPLDLSIDVMRVLRWSLDDDDCLLDGEILSHPDGNRELVRMPVALIACQALERIFGPAAPPLELTPDLPPSLRSAGLAPEDVHLFPWDTLRRRDLALGTGIGAQQASPAERERHRGWLNRFGQHFFDDGGQPGCGRPCPLFVPAAARALSCLFAQPTI